jgi:superfamily II DNA or RNA helicase
MKSKLDMETRFWAKVLFGDDCWEWTGAFKAVSRSKSGGKTLPYGKFRVSSGNTGTRAAHKVSFLLWYGREASLPLLHTCDNPKCVRPTHLKEGTLSKNMQEAWERGRRGGMSNVSADNDGYDAFVARKLAVNVPTGIADATVSSPYLFSFQRDLVQWALRRGRAAIFADTGLGKSRMQLTWALHVYEHTQRPVLILAPLAVAEQTRDEGAAIGIDVRVCRESEDIGPGINIINYDRMHKLDASVFGAVVLDESSIIKHHTAKTLQTLLDMFASTPFRLACTATPSPNDYTELGTHAEFLGVCTRAEMLSEYFVHDGGETQKWRLKGHAREAFWRFVASWCALVRSPADLGYDAARTSCRRSRSSTTPSKLTRKACVLAGLLFAQPANTLSERRSARKGSVGARVQQCAELVNADDEPWVVWCDLNAESEALTKAIRGAVEIRGSHTIEEKEDALRAFARGEARVIVSKSSICGFGLNWQHCARMAFVGVTDSWEAYYQAVRRCYRFGQKRAGQRPHLRERARGRGGREPPAQGAGRAGDVQSCRARRPRWCAPRSAARAA